MKKLKRGSIYLVTKKYCYFSEEETNECGILLEYLNTTKNGCYKFWRLAVNCICCTAEWEEDGPPEDSDYEFFDVEEPGYFKYVEVPKTDLPLYISRPIIFPRFTQILSHIK